MAEPSYVAEAFKFRPNMIFVGVGLVAAAVLSSAFVLGGVVGIELFYLFAMSTNPRFRRAIKSRNGR